MGEAFGGKETAGSKQIVSMNMIRLWVGATIIGILIGGSFCLDPAQASGRETRSSAIAAPDTTVRRGGYAALTDWPASLPGLLDEMGTKAPYLLPKIDSLSLNYRYAAGDSTSTWSFVLEWDPGDRVLYEGNVLPRRRAPSELRMENVELRARVRTDGAYVGDMIVAVDSMRLASSPSIYTFEVTVDHERVFLDVPGKTAREALLRGVTLEGLVVERVGFESKVLSTSERRREPEDADRPRDPEEPDRRPDDRPPRIYIPGTDIVIAGGGGGREGKRDETTEEDRDGDPRADAPRGETVGRQRDSEEEQGERSSEAEEEEEEDDDNESLRMLTLGAVASVGLLAYAGGTIGLYGRGDTPLGLAAGYTRPGGGIQLQAAVNAPLLEGRSGQKMTVKAMGFYDVFDARIQPAMGLGFQIDTTHDRGIVPAASLGVAANFHRFVIIGGVDVVQQTPEIGIAYNFRYNR